MIIGQGYEDGYLSEAEVRALAPEAPLDVFILQNIACPVTRAERGRRLQRDALRVAEY